ncbi:class I SAM-dependent methyltransferase [Candidatus Giovannonibacteria bacterium]|nr:class I SAM-dependent methyltransferase [Candidatus Giovannonibacteria bacterium]
MKNKDLKKIYDKIYKKGERKHYSSILFSGDRVPPAKQEVLKEISWKGKTVLDAGCGTGELAHLISKKGAKKVLGIDYSESAINEAKKQYQNKNLFFEKSDLNNISGKFDVIISLGTLEHLDDPLGALTNLKNKLNPGGHLIITCPNWSNARGYILLALKYLFDAKITLADLHYLTPVEFENWSKNLGMKLSWRTVEQEWGHGEKMIKDFQRRLPNVLKDFKVKKNDINDFIIWLQAHTAPLEVSSKSSGAVGLYHFRK